MTQTVTPLPQFPRNPSCTSCDLHIGAHTVCNPTVHFPSLPLSPTTPVVYFLGMNPGYNEDKEGRPFSPNGAAGRIFNRAYLPGVRLAEHATILVSNAVRCPTPRTNPKPPHYACCFPLHSAPEIDSLARTHRLLVVALGAASATALFRHYTGKSAKLRDVFASPLRPFTTSTSHCFSVMATFHPAYLARDGNHIHAVADHMSLIRNWCRNTIATPSNPTIHPPRKPIWPPPPLPPCSDPCSSNPSPLGDTPSSTSTAPR